MSSYVKLAQLDRHEGVNTRGEHYNPGLAGSIPSGGKPVAEFILLRILREFGRTRRITEKLECLRNQFISVALQTEREASGAHDTINQTSSVYSLMLSHLSYFGKR